MIRLEGIRRIYMLGDLHLGIRNSSIEWSDIQSSFLLDEFIRLIDEDGFDPDRDILFQAGDWHHVRESTNVRILDVSLNIAGELCKKFKRGVYTILGNHDVYYRDRSDVHSLQGFDRIYDNFNIFSKADQLQIGDHKFLMLPWEESIDTLKETIGSYPDSDYIFCHTDFIGASLNKATKLEHGLDRRDLTKFKKVYSGHIHIRQENGNVLYIGTPYEMDRGDRGNQKGFYVLELEGDDIEERFIPNTYSPKHLKYDIADLLQLPKDRVKDLFSNNFVDLTISSKLSKDFPFSSFTEEIKDFGHRRIEFYPYVSDDLEDSPQSSEDHDYDIFKILDGRLNESKYPTDLSKEIRSRFKNIYDSLKNTSKYE
jgi:hypothetical protein